MIYFFIFIVSFIIVYLITPVIRYVGLSLDTIDKRNHRKIHKKVITTLGGLAVYFGFLGGLVVVALFDISFIKINISQLSGLIICSTLMMFLGMYDDSQGSGALTKFSVQIIISFLLIKTGFRLEKISIHNLVNIQLGILSVPITVLWLVGITNAINLIDGLDGLASGVVATISLFLGLYGLLLNEKFIIFVSLALMGSNLAFLKYNFYPAKIFLGDTGSLFLGFVVGSLAIYCPKGQSDNNVYFVPSVILFSIPILDTIMSIIRRALRRQNIFRGDASHIHHYLLKRGLPQYYVAVIFYIATFLLGIISIGALIQK